MSHSIQSISLKNFVQLELFKRPRWTGFKEEFYQANFVDSRFSRNLKDHLIITQCLKVGDFTYSLIFISCSARRKSPRPNYGNVAVKVRTWVSGWKLNGRRKMRMVGSRTLRSPTKFKKGSPCSVFQNLKRPSILSVCLLKLSFLKEKCIKTIYNVLFLSQATMSEVTNLEQILNSTLFELILTLELMF